MTIATEVRWSKPWQAAPVGLEADEEALAADTALAGSLLVPADEAPTPVAVAWWNEDVVNSKHISKSQRFGAESKNDSAAQKRRRILNKTDVRW